MKSDSNSLLMPRRSRRSIPRVDRFLLCLSLLVVGLCFRPPLSFAANSNLAASLAAGRTSSTSDERGVVQSFLYDNANRLTDIQFPSYSTQNVHFTYDNANRPLSATDSTGSTTYSYDSTLKRLTGVATVLGGSTFNRSYTYYPDGKRKALTLTVGATNYTWTYYWDAAGRLSSLSNPFSEATAWSFDHADRITGQTTTTATNTQLANLYTYGVSGLTGDPSTAPVYLRTIQQKINGSLFWTYTLQHSYLSQLLSQTGSGSDGTTESESYSFDLRGRLASESEQYNGGGHNYTNSGSFGYDLANNLEAQTGGWTYNSDDQATVANSGLGGLPAASGLGYDASGNLTGLNGMTLSYDPWGRVSSISGTPYGTVSFTYDFAGRRVSKAVNGTTTYYLYDGDLLLAEANGSGQVQTIYTWGAQGLISDRIGMTGTPQSRFYEFDATGSTRALLDQNGVGLSRGTYSAWGSGTGYTPGTPLAWNGRAGIYTDAETGLMLMGARYYSPSIGRFTSRDPAGFVVGANVYAYCGNDPVNFFDMLGFIPHPEGDTTWFGQFINRIRPEAYREESFHDAFERPWVLPIFRGPAGPAAVLVELHDAWYRWGYDTQDKKASPFQTWVEGTGAMLQAGSIAAMGMGGEGAEGAEGAISKAPTRLFRFGWPRESAERLASDAAKAEANPEFGIHGVSVSSVARRPAPSATWDEIAQHSNIYKTGTRDAHYTVELPKPVTPEIADLFNRVFGRE